MSVSLCVHVCVRGEREEQAGERRREKEDMLCVGVSAKACLQRPENKLCPVFFSFLHKGSMYGTQVIRFEQQSHFLIK